MDGRALGLDGRLVVLGMRREELQGDEARRSAAYIEGNAQDELLTACNRAAEDSGDPTRFTRADVRTISGEAPAGVDLYVTQLELVRGDLTCRWEGDGAAVLSRNTP